jgi:hypothetical protein
MTRHTFKLAALLATLALAGCDRWGPSPHAKLPDQSPRATLEKLIAARRQALYRDFEPLVVPGRCDELVNTLLAVDEFLSANQLLCNAVRERFTSGLSQSIDQSFLGTNLGLFSRYVELVSEQIDGDRAVVAFSVDEKLPLQHAELTLMDGQWRYDPGTGYNPQLPAAFQRMAKGLRQVLDDLKNGQLPANLVNDDPQRLIEEVRVRLQPGVKMLPGPGKADADGG